MGKQTKIAYCDSTVSPWVGCPSDGCELGEHCYARQLVNRYAGLKGWPADFSEPRFFEERIAKALKWNDLTGYSRPDGRYAKPWLNGYPRIIFWGDMTDFWAKPEMSTWIEDYLLELEESPHIHLFLTKRPGNMYQQFKRIGRVPKNFWLGTTLTTQATLVRAYGLKGIRAITPDAKLFLSIEPLLGRIDLPPNLGMDWVIVGGESGHDAREMVYDWAHNIFAWSGETGTKFFFKQWGDYRNYSAVAHIETFKEMPCTN